MAGGDGSSVRAGSDHSMPQDIRIYVLPVNDAPSFSVLPILVVQEGAGLVQVQAVHNVTAGPFEDYLPMALVIPTAIIHHHPLLTTFDISQMQKCDGCNDSCTAKCVSQATEQPDYQRCLLFCWSSKVSLNQSVTFQIADTTRMDLFVHAPSLSEQGLLTFQLVPHQTGYAEISVWLSDNGITPLQLSNDNKSEARVIRVAVQPQQHLHPTAAFVSNMQHCNRTVGNITTCFSSCQEQTAGSSDTARIHLLQSPGKVTMRNAIFSSPAVGFLPATSVRSCLGSAVDEELAFEAASPDSPLARSGLEYAVDYSIVGNNLYALEKHSDSILSFQFDDQAQLKLIDRQSSGLDRLRFESTALGAGGEAMDVCSFAALQVDGQELIISASGCLTQIEWYINSNNTNSKDPVDGAVEQDKLDQDILSRVLADTVGLWEFRKTSFEGPMRSNPLPQGVFECHAPNNCQFTRGRNEILCDEISSGTVIETAGVRDESDVLGAAVLMGPDCREHSDWDSPIAPFSLPSFLVNDGTSEFLQFDGEFNTGSLSNLLSAPFSLSSSSERLKPILTNMFTHYSIVYVNHRNDMYRSHSSDT